MDAKNGPSGSLTVEEARPEGWEAARFAQALVCAAIAGGEQGFECLLNREIFEVKAGASGGLCVAAGPHTDRAIRTARSYGLAEYAGASGMALTAAGVELTREAGLVFIGGPATGRPPARPRRRSRKVTLALGPDPGPWNGPLERHPDLESFYDAHPHLASGWGWRPGCRELGAAPIGSHEIPYVGAEWSGDGREWKITGAAPAHALEGRWQRGDHPVMGAVTATAWDTAEILVLASHTDLRPIVRALRYLHMPSLAEIGATVHRVAAGTWPPKDDGRRRPRRGGR